MRKPGYEEPESHSYGDPGYGLKETPVHAVEIHLLLVSCCEGKKEKEKPYQTKKNKREHNQYQNRIYIIPSDLTLKSEIFHIIRTLSVAALQ